MTTLYKPVLIESAEQAEALPVGTVAHPAMHLPVVKDGHDGWVNGARSMADDDLIEHGFHALVPIEAEEETRVTPEALDAAWQRAFARMNEAQRAYAPPPGRLEISLQTRLVTPWVES